MFPDGILSSSNDSQYSVFKSCQNAPDGVGESRYLISGEMDCSDFRRHLESQRHLPCQAWDDTRMLCQGTKLHIREIREGNGSLALSSSSVMTGSKEPESHGDFRYTAWEVVSATFGSP